jgi:hypothetical protein
MDLIKNGNLPNTTTVNKEEEMPYDGKTIGAETKTDKQGMKVEGESTGTTKSPSQA